VTSPDLADSDWDGVIDSAEDNDGDRLGNLGEQRFGTDPGRRDSDGDGTPDGAEDADGDGRSNAKQQDRRPLPAGLTPSLADALRDWGAVAGGCDSRNGTSRLVRCAFGPSGTGTRVVLVGDSHAMMMVDPIARVATRDGWRLVTMLKGGCSPILGTMNRGQWRLDRGRSCRRWRLKAIDAIAAQPPELVIITASESYKLVESDGHVIPRYRRPPLWQSGAERMIEHMPPGTNVLLLGDVPQNWNHPIHCLTRYAHDISRCVSRRQPLSKRGQERAFRAAAANTGQTFATLYGKVCSYDPCPLVQGKTLMWRDKSHLSGTFARKLTPSVRKTIRRVLD
jgi:hypothetical protein